MRRRIAIFVALIVAPATSVASFGQECRAPTLFSKCGAMRLEVVLGRITMVPLHRGPLRDARSPDDNQAVRESLVVNHEGTSPLVRYETTDERQSLTVEIVNFTQVVIVCEQFGGESPQRLEFRQPAQGDVRLVVDDGAAHREVVAASLWHLLLGEPRLCEQQLLPILEELRPSWQLGEMAKRLETELFKAALSEPCLSRAQLTELVEELGAPQFARRQSADRQIRAWGPAVLPFLDSLDVSGLNREQRSRIQCIRDSVTCDAVDSPRRAAQWLANDEKVWLALLRHADPQRRHLAAIRLMTMRPDTIDFDPYGDESSRQEQLAQLRLQIGY